MANQYLKKSRLTDDQFLIFLQLFIEERTAVEINRTLKDQYKISYSENSINKALDRIKNSLTKTEYMSSNGFMDSKQKLIHEYKIPLGRNVKDDTEIMQEVFWVTFLKGKIHMEIFLIGSKHLINLIRLLKSHKDQELNFNCQGLVSFKDKGIEELYSWDNSISNFIETHNLRMKKYYGLKSDGINYFYESILRYNFPFREDLFEFLKLHLQSER